MSGDVHVRFCERLGVKLPRATHLVILVDAHPRQAWLRKGVESDCGRNWPSSRLR